MTECIDGRFEFASATEARSFPLSGSNTASQSFSWPCGRMVRRSDSRRCFLIRH